jgi:hypothetical protein
LKPQFLADHFSLVYFDVICEKEIPLIDLDAVGTNLERPDTSELIWIEVGPKIGNPFYDVIILLEFSVRQGFLYLVGCGICRYFSWFYFYGFVDFVDEVGELGFGM